MSNKHKIQVAIAGLIALASVETKVMAATLEDSMEKCYGIAKAGLNDCQTATTNCAGASKKDGEPDSYLLMPKGLCGRIVGGKLKDKQ